MKKLLVSFLILAFLPAVSLAATYSLSINSAGSTSETGNTTVANGGVSTFYRDTTGTNDFYPQLDRHYAYGIQLVNVQPSEVQVAAGGDWSGVSISVFGKFKSESSDVPWESVEPVYFFKDEAVNSGATPEVRWIKIPPADLSRIYVVTSGVTPLGLATAKLIASEIPLDIDPPAIKLGTLSFTLGATTGTSSFASTDSLSQSIPEGTRCVILENTSQSGVTVCHNNTATDITDTGGEKSIPGADSHVYTGYLQDIKKVRLKAAQAVTVRVDCYSGYLYK